MSRLSNKTAVITGGNSGIGLETARQFVQEGAQIIITGQNEERLARAVEELGTRAQPYQLDVRSLKAIEDFAVFIEKRYGKIDILFANAGRGNFAPVNQITEGLYDQQFDINVKGLFFTVQQLLPRMRQGSSIILNASAVHEKGVPAGSIYFASKAAVRSFARSLAAELGPEGIRVNALSPGIVRTNFQESSNVGATGSEGFIEAVVNTAPLGREGTPDEIAKAAVFLASDDSSYITATDFVVDGGWMNV